MNNHLSINTNLSSIIAQNSLTKSSNELNTAIERMTTGYKINHASDNAANYSISTNMTTKIGAYQVAEENTKMGLDLLTTANESLSLIHDKLERLRALAVQSVNGSYSIQSKLAINKEASALVDEIERQMQTTEYNGINLTGAEKAKHDAEIPEGAQSVKDVSTFVFGKTYTINDKDDLLKLSELTNGGKNTTGVTFVMTSDIDLWDIENFTPIKSFKGTFDGNGYSVKNLTIHLEETNYVGIFNYIESATVKNLGIEGCDVIGADSTGGLCGVSSKSSIENCYMIGNVSGANHVGGLVGNSQINTKISNSYATGKVSGTVRYVGGFVGGISGNSTIENCYASVDVNSIANFSGAFVASVVNSNITNCYATGNVKSIKGFSGGFIGDTVTSTIKNCYSTGNVESDATGVGRYVGGFIGRNLSSTVSDCLSNSENGLVPIFHNGPHGDEENIASKTLFEMKNPEIMANFGITEENGWDFSGGGLPTLKGVGQKKDVHISLQVGTNATESSRIDITTGFKLDKLSSLYGICKNDKLDYIAIIDELTNIVSAKQTEYGAAQNRLESALEEISTQYENLVSSRSTLRDADVAKESSKYIKQQILQQASVTLLATANQSPAIALQLL